MQCNRSNLFKNIGALRCGTDFDSMVKRKSFFQRGRFSTEIPRNNLHTNFAQPSRQWRR